MQYRIEFDGGTSCNIPRLGFGNGYGSYKINDEPVHRCNFNQPMSANAAEINTLAYAVKAIRDRGIDTSQTSLVIIGDSMITIGWVNYIARKEKRKFSKKATEPFKDAVAKLYEVLPGFAQISAKWQPRIKSVATFGH